MENAITLENKKYVNLWPAFIGGGALIILGLVLSGAINQYIQTVLMFIGINIILSASLNIVNGYMGEFACGHGGFMLVGAYTSSVLSVLLFTNSPWLGAPLLPPSSAIFLFPLVIIAGGAVSAVAGLLVAIPSFKTRDDYLAIITIAANFIFVSLVNNLEFIGGSRGFMGMKTTIYAMEDIADLPYTLIWTMVFSTLSIFFIRRLMRSTFGKGISSIRHDEISAEIMGVNTNNMKIVAFMVSSGLAGVAGGLFAHVLGFINPSSFNIMKSTECLVMVYLGGMGSLSGSVMSAVIFTFLLEVMRPLQILKWVLIPLMLILLMQFRPEGLMGNRELTDLFPKLKPYFKRRDL